MTPRNQVIAQTAYPLIVALKADESSKEGKALNKNYATLAHKLPAMILQNGLPQATGFLLAKSSSEHAHQILLEHLITVFRNIDDDFKNIQKIEDFHQKIIDSNLTQVMRYTRESLEIAGWLRRYVQGVLKLDATGENEGETNVKEGAKL
ncbi:type III-B CRISPR module-associated protein Cmr5 [Celerinatantimonas sp. MCCC 1A17872]|uniref:type III-B CRISPR module-associated protein Cmr5 n=1 Tax=Celerinatantimonas sp. MCCC 1A17872 TaxID=3177514 RepID=UPI0038C82E2F